MPDGVAEERDTWVASVFQVDPRTYAGNANASGAAGSAAPPSAAAAGGFVDDLKHAATTAENFGGDVWSGVKIGAEAAEQKVEGGIDTVLEKAGKAADAVVEGAEKVVDKATGKDKPPPAEPSGPITLKSETEVSQPANRARTKLGVGERVTLTVTPGPGKWDASGAKLSSKSGSKVTMTAPVRPGEVEVTVEVGSQKQTLKFTVIAPSTAHLDRTATEHYDLGLPNVGLRGLIYLGPDDVNFLACSFIEDEIGAKASGSWSAKNGEGHSPNTQPLPCTDKVVSGKGTETSAEDHCWSGYIPGLKLTDWTGEMSWSIPWHWHCGSGKGLIGRVVQQVTTTKDGTSTLTKGGASFTAPLS